jgi:hypothetical protein
MDDERIRLICLFVYRLSTINKMHTRHIGVIQIKDEMHRDGFDELGEYFCKDSPMAHLLLPRKLARSGLLNIIGSFGWQKSDFK